MAGLLQRRNGASAAANPTRLDLSPLLKRAAVVGRERIALVTFVAGRRYRSLCLNHIRHLRRAGISNYVLVALDAFSLRRLQADAEPVLDATQLVNGIPEAGADRFGSRAFFAINGARYRALLAMLQAGISLFQLDLDVVVLRDPSEWLARHMAGNEVGRGVDMLLQSDARDGMTGLELDPDLIERRLGLRGAYNWTYVNGGTFFCRATPTTIALFRRVWERLSSSESPPNEQDLLNSELAAARGQLSWDLLPPASFPNGFVYFVRPIAGMQPVLVHANWIDGVEQKVYHLREAGLWALGNDAGYNKNDERLLSVGDGTDSGPGGHLGFAAHRRTLRDALAIAQALNRTLILPQLPISRTSSSRVRTLAHFFDYAGFARAFPQHRAHGPRLADAIEGASKVHIEVGRNDAPPPESQYATIRVPPPAMRTDGLNDVGLRKYLAPYSDARVLHLWTSYRRFSGRFATALIKSDFAARTQQGLRAAPRLQFLVQHVHRSIRRANLEPFDCIDAAVDEEYDSSLMGAKLDRSRAGSSMQTRLRAAADVLNSTRMLVVNDGDDHARRGLRVEATAILGDRVLWVNDHVPPWYSADFDTPLESGTHAHSVVEMMLCARARHFIGSLASPSTHAVCRLRSSSKGSGSRNGRTTACRDALGRTLPAKWAFF
jgi:hypothetical protein